MWESVGDLKDKKVRCKVCSHYCVISPGKRGFCNTRENIEGKLYTLIYGSCISTGSIDPVEKKPLYHFWPGSDAYSIATIGCSFRCQHCQNWEISQSHPDSNGEFAQFKQKDQTNFGARSFPLTKMTPEQVVSNVKRSKSRSIAYTYNEPTIWYEFIKDTSILAKREGIKNILVTNGYSSSEANRDYIKFIDGANIDIKAFSDKFYKEIVGIPSIKPVLETAEFFYKNGVHVELTTLIIPNQNDKESEIRELIQWVINKLGSEVPMHFSAYRPMYRMNEPSTSSNILEQYYEIAKKEGLQNVFLGNINSKRGNHSICPSCGEIIIHRHGYSISNKNLTENNTCKKCGSKIAIQGEITSSKARFF
ncbi:AmmeMemoRadiSam system radical SAM enzyme [Candidatus Lokiarchaeum ossiferum]